MKPATVLTLTVEQLEEILDLLPDPLFLIRDRDDIVVRCNAAYAEVLGVPAERVVGRPHESLLTVIDKDAQKERIRTLEAEGRYSTVEIQVRLPDGEARWALVSNSLVLVAGERYRLGCAQDITARKEAETQLSDALDLMPIAVLLVDRGSRVLWASRAADQLLADRDGLFVDGGELKTRSSRSTWLLGRQIEMAALTADGEGLEARGALLVPRPSGRRSLEVLVTPMPRETALEAFEQPGAAAVIVTDPEAAPPDAAEILGGLYELTPAESALSVLLAGDASLADAAEQLGITIQTARQRLKLIFEKTGTHRQSSLVRLLVRGPGAIWAIPERFMTSRS